MNRVGYILSAVLAVCVQAAVCAQPFELACRRNFWNDGRNVAGVREDSVSVSYAELYGGYVRGGFRDTWEAENSWSAGARAATVTHLKKFSMKGSFAFDQTSGSGMCGSMFINPGFYPVDALEFTPGRKTLQTYAFDGGFSADVAPHWRIGASIDFSAANYSKRKDLRHTNYRLDMTVVPGVMYHGGDFAVGAVYIFSKNSETVTAEQIGTAVSSYYAFLDKGLMYGDYGSWTGSSLHLSEVGVSGFPVKEILHGAALQLQWKRLYADAEYMYGYGTAGEKQSEWFNFPGHGVTARLGYAFTKGELRHSLRLEYGFRKQTNRENILEKVSENGITTTYNYGSCKIFLRQSNAVSCGYEVVGSLFDLRAAAEVTAREGLYTGMWPYVRYNDTVTASVDADAKVHVRSFDIGVSAGFVCGRTVEDGRTVSEQAAADREPFRLEDYYLMQNEFATAPRLGAGLSLRYNFLKGIYVEASGGFVHGFGLKYLPGSDRWTCGLKAGYTF